MRFVEGSDLKNVLEHEGKLAPERALAVLPRRDCSAHRSECHVPVLQTLARDEEQARRLGVLVFDESGSGGAPLRFHKLGIDPASGFGAGDASVSSRASVW
jgi:hypothetical protein